MKLGLCLGLAAALSVATVLPAAAEVEFGAPDFHNYMSRIGAVSCDWQYASNFRACPTPDVPPKPATAATPAKDKPKSK